MDKNIFKDDSKEFANVVDPQNRENSGDYDNPDFLEDAEDDEIPRKPRHMKQILALLVILAILAISLPNIPYLLSDKFRFLDQSRTLLEDEIVKLCRPAIVSVEAKIKTGKAQLLVQNGTGFNISPEGKIITNKHIVENAERVIVTFAGGKIYYADSLIVLPEADIAIISLKAENLPVLKLDMVKIQEGETVTIIGNPLGYYKIAQRGQIGEYHQVQGSTVQVFDIDIPVNPGSSGSPVINSRGNVVGVVFAYVEIEKEGNEVNRGLAIPVIGLPKKILM